MKSIVLLYNYIHSYIHACTCVLSFHTEKMAIWSCLLYSLLVSGTVKHIQSMVQRAGRLSVVIMVKFVYKCLLQHVADLYCGPGCHGGTSLANSWTKWLWWVPEPTGPPPPLKCVSCDFYDVGKHLPNNQQI